MTTDKKNRMTGDQYRRALEQLGLSQVGAADLLGVDDRTSRRWANEERPVPAPVARFLRYLLAIGKTGTQVIKKLEAA